MILVKSNLKLNKLQNSGYTSLDEILAGFREFAASTILKLIWAIKPVFHSLERFLFTLPLLQHLSPLSHDRIT